LNGLSQTSEFSNMASIPPGALVEFSGLCTRSSPHVRAQIGGCVCIPNLLDCGGAPRRWRPLAPCFRLRSTKTHLEWVFVEAKPVSVSPTGELQIISKELFGPEALHVSVDTNLPERVRKP
jgi:hypothetical protein